MVLLKYTGGYWFRVIKLSQAGNQVQGNQMHTKIAGGCCMTATHFMEAAVISQLPARMYSEL